MTTGTDSPRPRTLALADLRAEFALRLADLYGTEVPAYNTLVDVSREVNEDFVAAHGGRRRAARQHRPGDGGAARRDPGGLAARAGPGRAGVRRLRDVPGRLLRPAGRLEELGPGGLHRLPSGRRRRSWRATRSGCSPRCWSPPTGASSTRRRKRGWRSSSAPGPCSGPSCWSWPTDRPTAGGLDAADADRFLDLATAAFELSDRAGRPRLVLRAGADLRRRRRHRRGAVDPHQPPDAAGARHRRPLRADGGAGHHHDRRDPGPARLGGTRRAAAADLVQGAGRGTAVPARRRQRPAPARCGSASGRSSSAASRSPPGGATSTTGWSPRSTSASAASRPRRPAAPGSRWPGTCGGSTCPAPSGSWPLRGLAFFTYRVAGAPSTSSGHRLRQAPLRQAAPLPCGSWSRPACWCRSRSCTRTSCPAPPPVSSSRT